MHHFGYIPLVDSALNLPVFLHPWLMRGFIALILLGSSVSFAMDASALQADQAAANRLMETIPIAEWMGPLAPVALSPFFGLACLSGASILMSNGLLPENSLLMGNPALNDSRVFAALVLLALFTSMPRLTKVSKPVSQLGDFIETYAGIVIVLVVHYFGARAAGVEDEQAGMFFQAGLFSGSGQVIIAMVSIVNILVIQAVRAFFELLIFLSPVPFLDAFFEMINKTTCLILVSIYVYSPAAALIINLLLFLVCLVIFRRAHRRTVQFRENVLWPLWMKIRGQSTAD